MQNVSARSSTERRKQFATLPDKVPQVLAQDTIHLSSPAVVWPHRALESRRVFQDLLRRSVPKNESTNHPKEPPLIECRYYRQILYGCTNPNCETVTCLSYQKRTSTRPFRRFTVLSARTLATSLATQEKPEKGLCPYEPVPLSEEPEVGLFREESNKFHRNSKSFGASQFTSPSGNPEPVWGNRRSGSQSQKPKIDRQNRSRVKAGSQDGFVDENGNEKGNFKKSLKGKDPKSFTQNLFDTEAMKILQLVKFRDSFLNWAPWFKKEENIISRDSQGHVGVVSRETNVGMENEDESHSSHAKVPGTFTSVQKQMDEPIAVIPPLDQCPELRNDADTSCQSSHQSQTASPISLDSTSIVSNALSISQKTDEFVLQDRPSDGSDGDEIESSDYNLSLAVRATRNLTSKDARKPETRIAYVNPTRGASRATELLFENRATTPADPGPDPVELPQSLGRFTLENISALVDTVKRLHPGPGDGYTFLRSLGRATTVSRLSRFVGGTATQQEMNAVFATQSIIYVLSTTDALLRSFIGSADVVSSEYKQSVKFAEIIQAFRLLMEIDHHPRNIFPSLWISIGKVHPPISVRSKSALLKVCRSTKSDRPLIGSTSENHSVNTDFLGDVDAAHVVKIALAALVASIPECNLETWASVRRLRASGRIAPAFNGSHAATKLIDPLLKVMDSFDDELALSLMMRVARAVAARQCLFEISRFQRPSMNDGISVKNGDFMDVLLHEVIDSDTMDTISRQSSTASTSVGSKTTAELTHNEKGTQKPVTSQNSHFSILVEWLRSVVFSEWDGKAEISRWGPVGGALELMSHLCKLIFLKVERNPFVSPLTAFQLKFHLHMALTQKFSIPHFYLIGLMSWKCLQNGYLRKGIEIQYTCYHIHSSLCHLRLFLTFEQSTTQPCPRHLEAQW